MLPLPDLIRMVSTENQLVHDQTAGHSQAETLLQPRPSGNCINWVLRHTLERQLELLRQLSGRAE
jgi:hypothetical protein